MKINVEKACCSGCSACYNICPESCIEMTEDSEGFKYPVVDETKCINCRLCERVCHYNHTEKREFIPDVYAVANSDESIRNRSSSGGAFSLIARWVLDNKGTVVGAAFDDDFTVKHIFVSDDKNLPLLYGSKYVQSDLNRVFSEIMSLLDDGKMVLFSGTPCQVEGLLLFLRKKYANLITVDFICHGVPSPKIWKNYVNYQKKKLGNITGISFRDKTNGWKNFSMKIDVNGNESYIKPKWDDPFLSGFLSNLFLRPSCYDCKIKHTKHMSDITIGDFWMIEKFTQEFNDGCSVFIINTARGHKIFDGVTKNATYKQMNIDDVVRNNSNYTTSAGRNPLRKNAFKFIGERNFDKYIDKCNNNTFSRKMIRRIIGK